MQSMLKLDKMSCSIAIKASRLSELRILLSLCLYLSRATDHSNVLSHRVSIDWSLHMRGPLFKKILYMGYFLFSLKTFQRNLILLSSYRFNDFFFFSILQWRQFWGGSKCPLPPTFLPKGNRSLQNSWKCIIWIPFLENFPPGACPQTTGPNILRSVDVLIWTITLGYLCLCPDPHKMALPLHFKMELMPLFFCLF